MSSPLRQHFSEVLVRLAGERPGLLVVSGEDLGPLEWFSQVWPERVLTVPPLRSRLLVGQGVRRGGGEAVVLLDAGQVVLAPDLVSPMLLLSTDPLHLSAAYRGGMVVCQPGWQGDLPALLVGSLGHDAPVLLHLPEPMEGLPPGAEPERTAFGEPRVLHRGGRGLVVGSGRTAPAAALVADRLSTRHLEVTALDSHTVFPSSGVDAGVLTDHLLVGSLRAPRAGALEAVAVDPADLAGTVAAVQRLVS